MKKLYRFAVIALLIIFSAAFTANAETPYSHKGLSFSVPEFLKNDAQWAANANYIYAFCDNETNMEFNVSVYENEGYSYAGLDDEALEVYSRSLEESYDATVTVENYRLTSGFSGLKVNLGYTQGEKGISYWFATDEFCYDLDFVFYDESYISHAESIMSTVKIDGMPCVDSEAVKNDGEQAELLTDSYIYEPVDKSYTYDGISLTLPEILVEDKPWAEQNSVVSEWITDDMGLEVILNTDLNTSPLISFHDFKKSTLEAFYLGIEDSFEDGVISHSWEKLDVDGFGGAKLTMQCSDSEGNPYEVTVCCFSTAEKLYYVFIFEFDEIYNSYVEGVINSIKIDGTHYTEQTIVIIGGIILAFTVLVVLTVAVIIKKRAKKAAAEAEALAQMYMPAGVPVYYTPDGQPYTIQPVVAVPPQANVCNGYITAPDSVLDSRTVHVTHLKPSTAQYNENITEETEEK